MTIKLYTKGNAEINTSMLHTFWLPVRTSVGEEGVIEEQGGE